MKYYNSLILFILSWMVLLPLNTFCQNSNITVFGYIEDSASGEKLVGATIMAQNGKQYATTSNSFGFFTLTLPAGRISVSVSYTGYLDYQATFNSTKDIRLALKLAVDKEVLDDVVLYTTTDKKMQSDQIGKINMPTSIIKKMPKFLGENDVLKSLQTLPGISQGVEGTSGILVRGGSPDQNLFLLDGVSVYNPTHLGGVFSPFNGDAIKDVTIYKGGFPARYGGRLSSVVDMVMKDGNMKKLHGEGSIGMLASKLMLEGPLKKDKTSFMVSARRTYLDLLASPLIALTNSAEEKRKLGFYFYDINAKINHIISPKDRIYGSLFFSKDNYRLTTKTILPKFKSDEVSVARISWNNLIGSVRWNHVFNSKLFSNTTLHATRYQFGSYLDTDATVNTDTSSTHVKYTSLIKDFGIKTDFEYTPSTRHTLRMGVGASYKTFVPGVSTKKYTTNGNAVIDQVSDNGKQSSPELTVYAEDQWKVSEKFSANFGIHTSAFKTLNRWYSSVEPRFTANYKINQYFKLSGSYVHMRQYIHLLANNSISLPTDLWVPSSDKIKPMLSKQASLGVSTNFGDGDYELSLEGYYKTLDGVVEYKDGTNYFNSSANKWDDMVESGKGKSYGSEIFLQKKFGKSTGWISYALSWSDRQFPTINAGESFYYKYDRRHVVNVVYMQRLSERWQMSAIWQFQSGAPFTIPTSKYKFIPQSSPYEQPFFPPYTAVQYLDGRNNFRLLDYHRLDLSFTWSKQKKNYEKYWNFSFYNVYNRKNPMIYYFEGDNKADGTNNQVLKGKGVFPFIPSISYGFKF